VVLDWNGQTWSPRELAKALGFKTDTIYARLRAGWPVERIVSTPVRKWERCSQ
jgi:hypothetical protein